MKEQTIILPPNSKPGLGDQYQLTMKVPKRRYWSYLRERWWVIVIATALALAAVLAYETVRTGKFQSYAQIYAPDSGGQSQMGMLTSLFSEGSLTYFGTQIELLKSSRLQEAAVEKIGINIQPGEDCPYKTRVFRPLGTSILALEATGPDPGLTQRFLQTVISEYQAYKRQTHAISSQEMLDSLKDELTQKQAELEAQENIWANFMRSNNVAGLTEEAKSAGTYLSELNLELAKNRLEQKLLIQGLAPISNPTNDAGNLAPTNQLGQLTNAIAANDSSSPPVTPTNFMAIADDPNLNSARLELAMLTGNKQSRIKYMGVHSYEEEVARLTRAVTILEADHRIRATAKLAELQDRTAAIESSIPQWEKRVFEINERLIQSQRLKENISRQEQYFEHMMSTVQNVDISRGVAPGQVMILQAATPGQAEKRYLTLRYILASYLGLFLGMGIVFGWYLLDDRFVSVRDVKDQYGENVLGLVPQIRVRRNQPKKALLEPNDPRPVYAEAFRHLRSALMLADLGEKRPQTLLFTSASRSEGKTTVAINLARTLVRGGLRVTLVDADTRHSRMYALLDEKPAPGIYDYLQGKATLGQILVPTKIAGLSFVSCGTPSPDNEGLFMRPQLGTLIQELRQSADFVVIDAASILASDDIALLVPHVDAIAVVARPFYTRSSRLRQALDMLYQRQAKNIQIIFNRARRDDMDGHYAKKGWETPTK